MSKKWIIEPFILMTAGDMSGNLITKSTNVKRLDNFGIQLVWSGTPVGTFDIQASVDGKNYVSLDFSSPVAASGSSGSHLINLNQIPYAWVRVAYTKNSGSGSLDITIMGKDLN